MIQWEVELNSPIYRRWYIVVGKDSQWVNKFLARWDALEGKLEGRQVQWVAASVDRWVH